MASPKVTYISPAAQAAAHSRAERALEQALHALRVELEFTREHLRRMNDLTAELLNGGAGTQVRSK
jgi:hypothetical protein